MNPSDNHNPNTIDAVVEEIIAELTLAEKVSAADLDENEFRVLELIMGKLIRYNLDQKDVAVNKELMRDCLAKSGKSLNEVDAATVILRELWNRMRETYKLRVVKKIIPL